MKSGCRNVSLTVLFVGIVIVCCAVDMVCAEIPGIAYWSVTYLDGSPSTLGATVALNAEELCYISYYKANQLKLAHQRWDGGGKVWTNFVVDPDGQAGAYNGNTAIAFPQGGYDPIIAYNGDILGTIWLKHATMQAGGSWNISGTAGDGTMASICTSPYTSGRIGVSYYNTMTKDLMYANYYSPASAEIVASSGDVGKFSDIGIGPDGYFQICYYDGQFIRYAKQTSTGWDLDSMTFWNSNPHAWSKIAVDRYNIPHMVYNSPYGLTYAVKSNGSWRVETLDTNDTRMFAIAVDNNGRPHVAYNTWSDMIYYIQKKGNAWTAPSVVEGGMTAFEFDMTLSSNNTPHLAYVGNAQLRHAIGHLAVVKPVNDFDGDGRSDLGCYGWNSGNWDVKQSSLGPWYAQFGFGGTIPFTGDLDGDSRCDYGVYFPPTGDWYMQYSAAGYRHLQFGYAGTVPIIGNFDGDAYDDFGVYHAESGMWYIQKSTAGLWSTQFGFGGTVPVIGDLDGDGKDDYGCYWPEGGWWFVMRSKDGFFAMQFGYSGAMPFIGDFDGDGFDDGALYDPTAKMMYLSTSSMGIKIYGPYMYPGMIAVAGDWDGDGISDYGCYNNGDWYLTLSQAGYFAESFGTGNSSPLGSR